MNKGLTAIVLLMTVALVDPAAAQPQKMPGGGAMQAPGGGQGMRMYDPQTVTTISGAVEKLEDFPMPGAGGQQTLKLRMAVVKTAQGSKAVLLGPDVYLDRVKMVLKSGDQVEVTGSRIPSQKLGEIIVAAEVKSGGKTFKLRDEQGVPVWAGAGKALGKGRQGKMGQ
jgi:hypothetical protein